MGSNCTNDPDMPKVGMIVTHKAGRWRVLRNIASGPFSDVFIVEDENSSHKYAMKCEKQEGNVRPVLKLDVLVLMAVRGHVGFPLFIAAGRTSTVRFSVPTALRVLQQTLSRLEVLHDAGWLCRDEHGEIIPPRSAAALLGTFQYTSLASHAHQDQARKDDLESWFYMAAELLKGPLPWSKIDGHKDHKLIGEKKRRIRAEGRAEFMEGMPAEFDTILTMIDNMEFYDRPPYDAIQALIDQAAEKLGLTLHEPFDWQQNVRVLRKAEFVGELGESNLASMKMDEDGEESTDHSVDTTPIDIES
ncbi:STYKc [Parelaphostrongylus tenuis]|uniref:STYKc n=1 Tax=Parelaphostrongylus tenuis TaxID=148309 RepID=A0AAD5WKF2_PARTN|nr:STYKc [Parelaphostrongylus tenuis]